MTREQATQKYPTLMAYIAARNELHATSQWCNQLHRDEADARDGKFADVAAEMTRARADYRAQQEAQGKNGYPYNRSMGDFLGLPIQPGNNEPEHGYYMANSLRNYYALGAAEREVRQLIAEGRELRVVIARHKSDGTPSRFARFTGAQIFLDTRTVTCSDSKRTVKLTSNWSVETTMENVARALRTGAHYGATTESVRTTYPGERAHG